MTIYHAMALDRYHLVDGVLSEPLAGDVRHKPFAASSSGTWLHCAHSVLPPPTGRRPSGDAAKEGTAAHLLLSWILSHKAIGKRPPIPTKRQTHPCLLYTSPSPRD